MVLLASLLAFAIIVVTYPEVVSLAKFSFVAKNAVCTVTGAILVNSTCTWRYPDTVITYECANATIEYCAVPKGILGPPDFGEYQVENIKTFITILDSDFPFPTVGNDSNVRMSQHIASDYYNGSSRTCWIRGEEVRFKIHDMLTYYIIIVANGASVFAILCSILIRYRKIILSACLRREDMALSEGLDATPDRMVALEEIPSRY